MLDKINALVSSVKPLNMAVNLLADRILSKNEAQAACNIICYYNYRWGPCYQDGICVNNYRQDYQSQYCCHGADCVTYCNGWVDTLNWRCC